MNGKFKKLLAGVMALAVMAPMTGVYADETETENTSAEQSADGAEEEETANPVDEEFVKRTDDDALSSMELVSENDGYEFYACTDVSDEAQEKFGVNPKEKGNLFAIKNKATGYVWWSAPINAYGDENATNSLRRQLASAVVITYGIPKDRSSKTLRSANKASAKCTSIDGGVKVVYTFKDCGAKIPIEYTLCDDYINVKVDVENIEEKDIDPSTGTLLTSISVFNSFGAAYNDEEGSFVIPDGSGALIDFNNGKTTSKSYSAKVYGADVSAVPTTKPAVTQKVYMPVYGILKGDNAALCVIDKGDANATLTASVSGQSKSGYNVCGFTFMLRGSESYLMNGEASEFTVFEHGEIKTDNIEMRYYPISGSNLSFADVALKYRDYLEKDEGIAAASAADPSLYVNLYGGVEKQQSILGLPVTLNTEITGFEQAKTIVEELKNSGAENMILTYDNWTDAGIEGKVDYEADPAGALGGDGDFEELTGYLKNNNVSLYPSVNNKGFVSGDGYFTFTDTTTRISGSYSRLITYDRAYGIQSTFYDPVSLLSPLTFGEVYSDLTENYSEAGLGGVSLGEMTSALYGDYGKETISRDKAMSIMEESYNKIQSGVGSILADTANAYAFPMVDHITNVPLSSSEFDIFDADVPFYHVAMHGLKPYSTKAVNASADYKEVMLRGLATGSNLNYDMVYEETSELKDTVFDIYFYANYKYWTEAAAKGYELSKNVLGGTANARIIGYEENEDVITTTYENGTVTKINLSTGDIDVNGTKYNLDDYTGEGGSGK